ncbi:hypothetical protein JXB12_06265 [candidate division KSB1 bacterium]|nr:hypothetical protein [candidate division KSB1 bacterium]
MSLKKCTSFALILISLITFSPIAARSQELYHKIYPCWGIGASAGLSYFFPSDLNDYIDLTVPGAISGLDKEHINTGIDVGLFLMYNPYSYLEIVPELNYLYSRRAFSQVDVSWEYPFSNSQNWDGDAIGFHGAIGGEMMLSDHLTMTLIFIGRYADIKKLYDAHDHAILVPGSSRHLHLNFSGIALEIKVGYYL